MEATITFADGTELTVDDLFAHVVELGGDPSSETPSKLARALFVLDPEVAEITVDPNGKPQVFAPSRADFGEGWGQ